MGAAGRSCFSMQDWQGNVDSLTDCMPALCYPIARVCQSQLFKVNWKIRLLQKIKSEYTEREGKAFEKRSYPCYTR